MQPSHAAPISSLALAVTLVVGISLLGPEAHAQPPTTVGRGAGTPVPSVPPAVTAGR